MTGRWPWRHGVSDDRGALSVELVIVAPVLIAVVLLLVAAGRIQVATTAMQSAAGAASRAASIALTSAEAEIEATEVARTTLSESGYLCATLTVEVDDSGLASPLGVSGTVAVTVTCDLALADIALPGLGGTRTFTATALSPVDSFRERN
ncbi:pilus assembly protein [Pseudoclavibacter chungangensis]|uniref:Pilus assembly protein n=1 Tax=Pseudoclavibacter chungangensis TaxID=587635 RepID=A0A7J5C0X7_9MICO|nr:pilus assembly protein [Pseudoclavibacter chungangensis]